MRNSGAAYPHPGVALAALALLVAWLPALAFLGHWHADPVTPGDPHVALVALHTHAPGLGVHLHTSVAPRTPTDSDSTDGRTAHADHGHGGGIATAFAAVVPAPVMPLALPTQPAARPAVQERAPDAIRASPLVPPPQSAL